MYVLRKRVRTVEQERRTRRLELIGLTVVVLVTLFLVWKAMQAG